MALDPARVLLGLAQSLLVVGLDEEEATAVELAPLKGAILSAVTMKKGQYLIVLAQMASSFELIVVQPS